MLSHHLTTFSGSLLLPEVALFGCHSEVFIILPYLSSQLHLPSLLESFFNSRIKQRMYAPNCTLLNQVLLHTCICSRNCLPFCFACWGFSESFKKQLRYCSALTTACATLKSQSQAPKAVWQALVGALWTLSGSYSDLGHIHLSELQVPCL